MKTIKKIVCLLMTLVIALSFVGCNRGDDNPTGNQLPDFPETPADKNSWEYADEEITIDWFVNYSWFSYANSGYDEISKVIKQKTGVTVRFTSPVDDTGEMLNVMIGGDTLPDVISVQAYQTKATQLALEGYVYSINDLAEKWAPSLLNRIEPDIQAYYQLADGDLYGLPSCAYSTKYVTEDEKWAPNGGMLVRKDWYEWYQSQPDKMDITTPTGLLDAMKRVTAQFKSSSVNATGVLIDRFSEEGNQGVTWLSQYFAAPFEDKQGNYVDQRTTPQYKETLLFLNQCYREGLMRKSNISATADEVASILSKGEAFVALVTPQNYPGSFINAYNNNVEYIPLIVRNSAGEDPVLQDLTGNGFLLSMVTKNAERPDVIIKLLDFLYSEEGQLLCQFGIEGDTWNWADESKTQVKWTQKYLDMKKAGSTASYGFGCFNTLYNPAYIEPISPLEGKTQSEAYTENLKRALMPFSYRYGISWPKLDVTADNYLDIVQSEAKVLAVWAEYLPSIVKASSAKSAEDLLAEAISAMDRRGREEVIATYAQAYAENKQKLGVTWGWPLNDPNYKSPTMRNADGTFSTTPVGPNGDTWYLRNYIVN